MSARSGSADTSERLTFFCGGSRNHADFLDVFDAVFVLSVDLATLDRRLDARPPDEFGGQPEERALIRRLHHTGEDLPAGAIVIDATQPLDAVVDDILRQTAIR